METITTTNLATSNTLWTNISEKRHWNGMNFTITYGNYLKTWWHKNKTEYFARLVSSNDSLEDLGFYQNFEEMPYEMQSLLSTTLQGGEVFYHKTISLEHRGFLQILIQKKGSDVRLDLFSKNFHYEKIILKYFYLKEDHKISPEFLAYLKKSQELLKKNNSLSELEIITKKYQLPDLLNRSCSPSLNGELSTELSLRTKTYASSLLAEIQKYKKTWFEQFSDFGLSLVSEYDALRLHLLKFLAILPCLDHDKSGHEVKRLFVESLELLNEEKKSLPIFISIFLPFLVLVSKVLPPFILAPVLRYASSMMAKRFIAGENISNSISTLQDLKQTGRDATLDQLGELVLSETEADHYKNKVLEIIEGLKKFYPHGERNAAGILRAHISVKTTALGSQLKAHAYEDSYQKIAPRLKEILRAAKAAKVFVNIDAEHYHFRDLVWKIYSQVLKENLELYQWQDTGIVVQAYLTDAMDHLKDILHFQQERKTNMPIRLVKGAYWDAETIEAKAHHFDPPQFLNKIETDIHFRQLAHQLLSHNYVQLVIASHNVLDHAYGESLRTTLFPQAPVIEHQCLHMTYEALSVALVKMGYAVRNYMPVGNLLVGMAYLVRRIMENSSQVGVLKMLRSHQHINPEEDILKVWMEKQNSWQHSHLTTYEDQIFSNVAPVRFYLHGKWKQFDQVKNVLNSFFRENGILVPYQQTPVKEVTQLMHQLHGEWAHSSWKTDTSTRVLKLLQVAEWFQIFRDEISYLIMQEAHKSLLEAYADVDEAIDFITFYVEQFLENPLQEKIHSLGVVAAITPWNFPLAIPTGMVVAPLIAGNAVVLKSAEQTPQIAQVLASFIHRSGISQNIFKHFVGSGETVGVAVTDSQDLHGLVFTGSAAVGTLLYKKLSNRLVENKLGLKFIRPVITEMGGKNPIIVTQNAELDETISGILYSAFAHAGQKCSACSRVLVDNKILPIFKKRLLSSIETIKVGLVSDPAVLINPVITAADKNRLKEFKKNAAEEAISVGGKVLLDLQDKYADPLLGPLVIEVPIAKALDGESYAQKEAFGPIIHIVGFDNLQEALKIANTTPYALTAGLYAQSPKDIQYFMEKIECGNIYINRPNTGARVGIEPFGGFKMSGTGPKAGGAFYVQSFLFDQDEHGFLNHKEEKTISIISEDSIYPLPQLTSNSQSEGKSTFFREVLDVVKKVFITPTHFLTHEQKLLWENHANYLLAQPEDLLAQENIFCPGQKSFSTWSLKKKLGIYWQTKNNLDMKDILFITYFLRHRIPMILVLETEESKVYWKNFMKQLELLNYPINTLVVWEADHKKIFREIQQLSSLELLHIAVDDIQTYNQLVEKLLVSFSYKKVLPLILSSFSSHYSLLPQSIESFFTHERAYAVNVMRHGAPLED
jgi:RHH-type proline utilization regulon transcriptional repressor/proline dehydrogenase/delta 1-pyrroline-5-carboxylate dehydrogenase